MSKKWEDRPSQEGAGYWQDMRGIPHSIFKTKGEMVLSQQQDMKEILQSINANLGRREGSSMELPERRLDILPPEVNIDISGLATDLKPQFNAMIDAQRDLHQATVGLGWMGQRTLEETKLSNKFLNVLSHQGQYAMQQRTVMIDELAASNQHFSCMNNGIRNLTSVVKSGTSAVVDSLNHGFAESSALQVIGTIKTIDVIDDGFSFLGKTIDDGFCCIGDEIDLTRRSIVGGLQEIGDAILTMTNEQVKTRLLVIEELKMLRGVFLWSHRENMMAMRHLVDIQRGIAHLLGNPRATQSFELWKMAEQCRLLGRIDQAKTLLNEAHILDPTNPRVHFSFGITHLNAGDSTQAVASFQEAASFAEIQDEGILAALARMHGAKLLRIDGRPDIAYQSLDQALVTDKKNFEVWYEGACCAYLIGDMNEAKAALEFLIKNSLKYRLKIISDPVFEKLKGFIFDTIAKYS